MASQNIPRSNSKQKHSLFALLPLQLLWLAFFCLLFVATTQSAALFQKRSNLFQVISFWVSAHGITNIQIDRQVQWFGWHHLHYGLKLPLLLTISAKVTNDTTKIQENFKSETCLILVWVTVCSYLVAGNKIRQILHVYYILWNSQLFYQFSLK